MPYGFSIFHNLRLVYRRAWGTYDDAQVYGAHEEWRAGVGEGEERYYNALLDMRSVTSYEVTPEAMRRQAYAGRSIWNIRENASLVRVAYVVPSPLAFGTGRIFGSLTNETGARFRVFDLMDVAAEWLALSHTELASVLGSLSPVEAQVSSTTAIPNSARIKSRRLFK